jgi:hypothetical protein
MKWSRKSLLNGVLICLLILIYWYFRWEVSSIQDERLKGTAILTYGIIYCYLIPPFLAMLIFNNSNVLQGTLLTKIILGVLMLISLLSGLFIFSRGLFEASMFFVPIIQVCFPLFIVYRITRQRAL